MVRWENGKDESYMRIVVLDGYTENPGDLSWKGLEDLGDLTVYDRTPKDRVVERIGQAEAVYTNKTPISARTIESCPNLRFIGVLATGYNIVDIRRCRDHCFQHSFLRHRCSGPVCHCPASGAVPPYGLPF